MKKYIISLLFALPLFSACFKDKGNYDYTELPEITITGVPTEIEVLANLENITVSPTITSSTDGAIHDNDPNYTVEYKLGYKSMGSMTDTDGSRKVFLTLNPEGNINLDVPANYSPGNYRCWMTVTDNRNNVTHSHFFDVIISTTTYEGWLVLCNEGPQQRARLDMISVISSTRTETIHDIAKGLPEIHHATQVAFHPTQASPGARVYIFSREGSYLLDNSTLESDELQEFNLNSFLTMPGGGTETILNFTSMSVTGDYSYMIKYSFAFSDANNAYVKDYQAGGAVFELPLNTTKAGTPPEFRVAPYAGFSEVRPANGTKALFYDIDNKRFLGWSRSAYQVMSPLNDPTEGMLFSYQTGKDLVYMEGTRRSNGLVYAILQDEQNRRSICAVNMGGNGFVQEGYYENVTAPDFEKAEHFAFHSQYPVMFYATPKKVYLYNLGTETAYDITKTVMNDSEEVTRLKFNLFRNSSLSNLNKDNEEFLNQQFQLIVCTYDENLGVDGGRVGFYELNPTSNTVSKVVDYNGFAKVKDIVYRER